MNFYINKPVFSFKFILILSTLFISFFKTASSSTTFTKTEIDIFEDVYNSFFCYSAVFSYFQQSNCYYSYIAKFIRYGLEKSVPFKNNPTKLANVYYGKRTLLSRAIDLGYTEILDIFVEYAKAGSFNFNLNFDLDNWGVYCDMAGNSVDYDFDGRFDDFNPLLYAVFKNDKKSVKTLLNDKHGNLLKLDTVKIYISGKDSMFVRSIARRIINKTDRELMLEALRADPKKHDMTGIKKNLKNDLKITVREAVLNNSCAMLEAALWLGNFGNSKADTNVIKYAVNNKRYEMVEILVLEGFAKPVLSDAILNLKFSGNELERIKYILDPNQTRPPKSN